MIDFNELVLGFTKLGLKEGDVVLVHSSFKSFGGVNGGAKTVIDALLHVITENGTLIVPTFNYDFCDGKKYDVKNTKSKMGIISELVMNDKRSKRSLDPVFSFACIGKEQDYITRMDSNHPFGYDSVFMKLRNLNGKIMIIGLPYNTSMTFFHHVEESIRVDYRYFKQFDGEIVDHNGKTQDSDIVLYVRDIEKGVINNLDVMGKILEDEKLVQISKIGESDVKLMDANTVFQRVKKEIKKNNHILIQIIP